MLNNISLQERFLLKKSHGVFSTMCVADNIFSFSFYLRCTFDCSCIGFVFPPVRNKALFLKKVDSVP